MKQVNFHLYKYLCNKLNIIIREPNFRHVQKHVDKTE